MLVIIDTLQMIRGAGYDNTYANDYRDLSALKRIADARSNGKRLIELRRAESDDTQDTRTVDPIDPADVSGGENAPCFAL